MLSVLKLTSAVVSVKSVFLDGFTVAMVMYRMTYQNVTKGTK